MSVTVYRFVAIILKVQSTPDIFESFESLELQENEGKQI